MGGVTHTFIGKGGRVHQPGLLFFSLSHLLQWRKSSSARKFTLSLSSPLGPHVVSASAATPSTSGGLPSFTRTILVLNSLWLAWKMLIQQPVAVEFRQGAGCRCCAD